MRDHRNVKSLGKGGQEASKDVHDDYTNITDASGDDQGFGEDVQDEYTNIVDASGDDQGFGEDIDDEYVRNQEYELVDDQGASDGSPSSVFGDAENKYVPIVKDEKASLWQRLKRFLSKLAQSNGLAWKVLDAFIDTVDILLTSIVGPFYLIVKVLTREGIKWIRAKIEGKMIDYLLSP